MGGEVALDETARIFPLAGFGIVAIGGGIHVECVQAPTVVLEGGIDCGGGFEGAQPGIEQDHAIGLGQAGNVCGMALGAMIDQFRSLADGRPLLRRCHVE